MVLQTPGAHRSRQRTVLVARSDGPWTLATAHRRDRLLLWLRALELDQALARGRPAEHDRLHALRAATLVSPAARRALADDWERVLAGLHQPAAVRTGRVPLQRAPVQAAAEHIRRLIEALRAAGPVPVRGVALATVLLTDGGSPLYHAESQVDLAAAVRDATHLLDPRANVVT